ncbi:hypothetical protein GCM10010329_81330 [Streptomyces spiroverticillatus]|nr:hypothetical protein GCM10010329_81330 [Streptomyces spiroverticillatus]
MPYTPKAGEGAECDLRERGSRKPGGFVGRPAVRELHDQLTALTAV